MWKCVVDGGGGMAKEEEHLNFQEKVVEQEHWADQEVEVIVEGQGRGIL